jgi:pyruvate dehydrogenase E2 component (dihydrolipoamide acetyltransferase)
MYEFKMPSLGAEMDSGRLVEWKVKLGDRVKKQDIIAVVDTDKAAIEIECWQSGVVEKLLVEAGEKVPVGTVLALIREDVQDSANSNLIHTDQIQTERIKITPRAKSLAQKLAINISQIKGTGPDGTITETDLQNLNPTEKSKEDQSLAMQKIIAAAMAKSKREIPHFYLSYAIDMTKSLDWLEKYNRSLPVSERMIYAVLLIKATALAVKDHPEFNGFWLNDSFKKADDVNIGIVISLRQGGLLAPAIQGVDRLALAKLMKNMSDLVVRARSGSLRSSEVEGPTITITNLGEYGVDSVFGVIYPPQIAIVGFGKVSSQKSIVATLSADHRVSDGHRGSRFLTSIGQYLQQPEKL